MGVRKLNFCQKFCVLCFFCVFALDVGPLWHSNNVLRVVFMMFMQCITFLVYVCTLGVWWNASLETLMSTKLWGFACFLFRNMFASLVVYFAHLAPHVHFRVISCIALRHHMYAPLLPLPCLGLYLVSSSLACHIYLMLYSIVFLRCFVLFPSSYINFKSSIVKLL